MPRPPKHVPPETLGGRIRAARERLHLSLAHVAAGRYSTSLISQIERNRIEPSPESLKFLAEQLQIPLEDLQVLARHQHEADAEEQQVEFYEELRAEASEALTNQRPYDARDRLMELNLSHIPSSLRWRLAALRGHCHFALRQFLPAQKDFLYAVTELPEVIPANQHLEVMTLHLHLAAAHRELKQLDDAFEQFQLALNMMNASTSLNYVAEAHWGLSLIAFDRAHQTKCSDKRETQLNLALKHAENACILYRSIGEILRADLLMCQIGLIEQALGKLDDARKHLAEVLQTWTPELDKRLNMPTPSKTDKRRTQEIANVVSAVACSLAGIELAAENHQQALTYVHQARDAGQHSYILRRAEAEIMLGRILEAMGDPNQEAEQAFRNAVALLTPTNRIAARIRAHNFLGRHLLKKGQTKAGDAELDERDRLSHLASASLSTTISTDNEHNEHNDGSKAD